MNYQYHKLRPAQLLQRRQQLPVAYIGLGVLEWHGLHNPLGLDGVKADAVVGYLAERLGGVVMPPLYWGDHRGMLAETLFDSKISSWLGEDYGDHCSVIAEVMQIPKQRMLNEAARSVENGGWRLWRELMVHMLFQFESLGFKLIIAYPGHYPLQQVLTDAIDSYQTQGGTSQVFQLHDKLAGGSDHAAKFETSLLMKLTPELVDLSQLNPEDKYHLGVDGDDPLKYASAEYGQQILDKFEQIVKQQIANLI